MCNPSCRHELRCCSCYSTSIHHATAVIRHVALHEAAVESAFGESFYCLFVFHCNFWVERLQVVLAREILMQCLWWNFSVPSLDVSVHSSASQREKWRAGCYAILRRSAFVEIVTYSIFIFANTLRARASKSSTFLFNSELSGFQSFTPAGTFKNPSAFIASNLVRGSALWFAIILLSRWILEIYFAIN